MTVVLVALLAGAIAGVAGGGRPANLASARIRSGGLLLLGAGGQAAVGLAGLRGYPGLALVVASYAALAAFAVRNLAIAGMGVIVLGIVLNLIPIVADGGMPVEGTAIVRAHVAAPEDVPLLRYGGKRHLAHQGDHLRILDDRIPDWLTHEVLSAGDLVIGAGVAAVVARLLRGRRSLRRRRSPVAASSAAGSDRPATG